MSSTSTFSPPEISAAVISWLSNAGGWGGGAMQIDFSIKVLEADASAPFRSFTRTEDFYQPDCDFQSVPVPAGGAIEGEDGYECVGNGDCHLIVVHRPSGRIIGTYRIQTTEMAAAARLM